MKKSSFVILLITIFLIAGLALAFNYKKQAIQSQQTIALMKQQLQTKNSRLALKNRQIAQLSRKLETAENRRILSYKLESGDTLYELFGSSWQKVAKMNNIKRAENLQAGKTIYFPGYLIRVNKGQNFYCLFKQNWQRIARLNGFDPWQAKNLRAGQPLMVPYIT